MTDEQLPPRPAANASYGDRDYYRRRLDELVDRRLLGIEEAIRDLDKRADSLDKRVAYLAGALAVATFLANLIGPPLVRAVFGAP